MSRREPIYLDHHATTPVDPRVLEAMLPFFSRDFGNPASHGHVFGWRAEAAVEQGRERLARAIGAADPREIVFTSGATESNNLALFGALRARSPARDHLVTVVTEHRAVLDPARVLEDQGFRVTRLRVDSRGLVDPEDLRAAVDGRTALVSVMAAHNEIGVLQPLAELAAIAHEAGAWFHTDAAQALGKVPLDVQELGVDLLSCTAHKLYGPKGVGALYLRGSRPRVRLVPILHGGGHERGLRSGTLPVPLIVGFGRAAEIATLEREAEARRLRELRERLFRGLSARLGGVHLNGDPERRLPGNLNVWLEGIRADELIAAMPDVAVSTGSACTSASGEPSHVLAALGLPRERVLGSIRIGLGRFTTAEEVDRAVERIAEEVVRRRALTAVR